MQPKDIPAIITLVTKYFPRQEREPECWLNRPYHCFVAELDKEIIGFILIDSGRDRLRIDLICVKKEHRRKGYATRLLDRAAISLPRAKPYSAYIVVAAGRGFFGNLLSRTVYEDEHIKFTLAANGDITEVTP